MGVSQLWGQVQRQLDASEILRQQMCLAGVPNLMETCQLKDGESKIINKQEVGITTTDENDDQIQCCAAQSNLDMLGCFCQSEFILDIVTKLDRCGAKDLVQFAQSESGCDIQFQQSPCTPFVDQINKADADDCSEVVMKVVDKVGSSYFSEACELTGYDNILSDKSQQITLLAPTDSAIASWAENSKSSLNELLGDVELMKKLVAAHILVNVSLTTDTLNQRRPNLFYSMLGDRVTISKVQRQMFANNQSVIAPNLLACNGVLHVLDGLLWPQSSPGSPTIQDKAPLLNILPIQKSSNILFIESEIRHESPQIEEGKDSSQLVDMLNELPELPPTTIQIEEHQEDRDDGFTQDNDVDQSTQGEPKEEDLPNGWQLVPLTQPLGEDPLQEDIMEESPVDIIMQLLQAASTPFNAPLFPIYIPQTDVLLSPEVEVEDADVQATGEVTELNQLDFGQQSNNEESDSFQGTIILPQQFRPILAPYSPQTTDKPSPTPTSTTRYPELMITNFRQFPEDTLLTSQNQDYQQQEYQQVNAYAISTSDGSLQVESVRDPFETEAAQQRFQSPQEYSSEFGTSTNGVKDSLPLLQFPPIQSDYTYSIQDDLTPIFGAQTPLVSGVYDTPLLLDRSIDFSSQYENSLNIGQSDVWMPGNPQQVLGQGQQGQGGLPLPGLGHPNQPPLPPNFAASEQCNCTEDGVSGGANTGVVGCWQEEKGFPPYCYVVDPLGCPESTPSDRYLGSGWRPCLLDDDFWSDGTYTGKAKGVASLQGNIIDNQPSPLLSIEEEFPFGCRCTASGMSGDQNTQAVGCGQHNRQDGSLCYVREPEVCPFANPSKRYLGAAWRYCDEENPDVIIAQPIADEVRSQLDPCRCSSSGFSGPTNTGSIGCGLHLDRIQSSVCYVVDPVNCRASIPSTVYPGASWRIC